jgi:hypothetical protein
MNDKTRKRKLQQQLQDKHKRIERDINKQYLEFVVDMSKVVRPERTLPVRAIPETG